MYNLNQLNGFIFHVMIYLNATMFENITRLLEKNYA